MRNLAIEQMPIHALADCRKLSTLRSHGQCRSGTRQLDRLRSSNVLSRLFLPGSELLLGVDEMLLLGGELLHLAL